MGSKKPLRVNKQLKKSKNKSAKTCKKFNKEDTHDFNNCFKVREQLKAVKTDFKLPHVNKKVAKANFVPTTFAGFTKNLE